jgi:chromosomal replication initiator protein
MEATDPRFWSAVCDRFQLEHADLYRSWFLELTPADMQAGSVGVTSDDPARIHYLRDRCATAFASVASAIAGRFVTFAFYGVDAAAPRSSAKRLDADSGGAPLDADYTFDEFVVGAANRLAHASCHAAVSDPGAVYNPLFIHGPSGLGKSHLMQATCTEMVRRRPETVLVYVTCEKFVNEFVEALAANRMDEFRRIYRNADLLAIDDVHVLASRESSQDEFFHTFNALYQSRRQILLSADVSPVEIPTLEERLVSRFNWGLVAPIGPPDQETRRAILKRKAQLRGYRARATCACSKACSTGWSCRPSSCRSRPRARRSRLPWRNSAPGPPASSRSATFSKWCRTTTAFAGPTCSASGGRARSCSRGTSACTWPASSRR